jgi:DMSO/TMAO reductase YedYZ molybdopterin-dependent catalytic subunit
LVGFLAAIPLSVMFYFGGALILFPIPYFVLFDWLIRNLPKGMAAFGIETLVAIFSAIPGVRVDQAAKLVENVIAILIFWGIGAVFGVVLTVLLNRMPKPTPGTITGLVGGLILLMPFLALIELTGAGANGTLITGSWLAIGFVLYGIAVGILLQYLIDLKSFTRPVDQARRRFLIEVGGTAIGVGVVGFGITRFLSGVSSIGNGGVGLSGGVAPTPTALPTGRAPGEFVAVEGTRLEVTPNALFFRVDVNSLPPAIDSKTWTLTMTGHIESPFKLSYDDLTALPSVEQYATLECISNPVGGELISTTRWKGVTLKSLLEKAKLKPGVVEIAFTCADGYTESLPLASCLDERTLLAYQMNDEPISSAHGYPARIYTPNRYGMKNPKWLTKIEPVTQPFFGYWENLGWDKEAIVKTDAMIDVIAAQRTPEGLIPIGGVAFAGSRGISKVEVSIDGGTWETARLKKPINGLTWVLWRYDWPAQKGYHTVTVRGYDGAGVIQIQKEAPLHPDGASGYVTKTTLVNS